MRDAKRQTVSFYSQHPISTEAILAKLRRGRGDLQNLTPEDLWPHDQDHFGGTVATDELVNEAGITEGAEVVDFCAGLGGTVRYLAHRYGVNVTGIELTPARVAGAQELIHHVGLQKRCRVLEGDISAVALPDNSADLVISQEAFCHVPNLERAFSEAHRILKRGGRLAFTDWVANEQLNSSDAELVWEGLALQPLQSLESYQTMVKAAGFSIQIVRDLTQEWIPILQARLQMYRELQKEARATGAPAGPNAFLRSYIRVVELIQQESLGGIRLIAQKS